jgi:hypothetical protein
VYRRPPLVGSREGLPSRQPRDTRSATDGAGRTAASTRMLGPAFPYQRPVSQPAAAPALHRTGRQTDIDDLEPQFLWPAAARQPPFPDARELAGERCTPNVPGVLSTAVSIAGPQGFPGLLVAYPGRPGRLGLPLRQFPRPTLQPSQGQPRSSTHAHDDAARAATIIMSRTDPHHADYPVAHT